MYTLKIAQIMTLHCLVFLTAVVRSIFCSPNSLFHSLNYIISLGNNWRDNKFVSCTNVALSQTLCLITLKVLVPWDQVAVNRRYAKAAATKLSSATAAERDDPVADP